MADLMISQNEKLVRQDIITQTEGYNVSKKYVPIATQDILTEIKDYTGSEPLITGFNNANVRKAEKNGFQKHALICEMPDAQMIDGTKINMILFNSNDRSTSLKIFIGAIRMACSNQMVWGEELTQPISIRHTQQEWKHSIHTLMDEYAETQRKTQEMIDNMMNRYVSYGDIGRFTERVVEELLAPDIVGSIFDPMQLNAAHRKEDTGKNLWNMFNRVQTNLLNGGVDRIIEKADDNGILFDVVSKTHKVTDTSKQIKFNRELHTMAMEML
jgi:hypothetical protein